MNDGCDGENEMKTSSLLARTTARTDSEINVSRGFPQKGQTHFWVSYLLTNINYTSLDFIVEGKTILTDEGFLYTFYVRKGMCEN